MQRSSNSQLRQLLTTGSLGDEVGETTSTNLPACTTPSSGPSVGYGSIYQQQMPSAQDGSYTDSYGSPLMTQSSKSTHVPDTSGIMSTSSSSGKLQSLSALDIFSNVDSNPWLVSSIDNDFDLGVSVLEQGQEQFEFGNISIDELTEQVLQSGGDGEVVENWTEQSILNELAANQVPALQAEDSSLSNRNSASSKPTHQQFAGSPVKHAEYGSGVSTSHFQSVSSPSSEASRYTSVANRDGSNSSASSVYRSMSLVEPIYTSPSQYQRTQSMPPEFVEINQGSPAVVLSPQESAMGYRVVNFAASPHPNPQAPSRKRARETNKIQIPSDLQYATSYNIASATAECVNQQNSCYQQPEQKFSHASNDWSNTSNGNYRQNIQLDQKPPYYSFQPAYPMMQMSMQAEQQVKFQQPLYVSSANQQLDYLASPNQQSGSMSLAHQQYQGMNSQNSKFDDASLVIQQASYTFTEDPLQKSPVQQNIPWSPRGGVAPDATLPPDHWTAKSQLTPRLSRPETLLPNQSPLQVQPSNQRAADNMTNQPLVSPHSTASGAQLHSPQVDAHQFTQAMNSGANTDTNRRKNTEQTLRECGLYDATVLTKKLITQDQQIQNELDEFKQLMAEFMEQLKVS